MSLRMFAIIFCVLWLAAILWWSDPLDVPMIAGVLTALAWFCLMGLWLNPPTAG
jgi:hypothetical protein